MGNMEPNQNSQPAPSHPPNEPTPQTVPAYPTPEQPSQLGGPQSPLSQPEVPAASNDQTNVIAIVGLIMAFVFPLVGLILSIIGYNQSKKTGGSGRVIAIIGIVLNLVWLLAGLMILLALASIGS